MGFAEDLEGWGIGMGRGEIRVGETEAEGCVV